jgi:hypothetical protein
MRYQNGALIQSPPSTNQLTAEWERSISDFLNVDQNFVYPVPGVNPLAVNPNCGCFNLQTTFVLNPKAWANPPGGVGFGGSFLQQLPLAAATGRIDELRSQLPFRRESRFFNISAPNSRTSSTGSSSNRQVSADWRVPNHSPHPRPPGA